MVSDSYKVDIRERGDKHSRLALTLVSRLVSSIWSQE